MTLLLEFYHYYRRKRRRKSTVAMRDSVTSGNAMFGKPPLLSSEKISSQIRFSSLKEVLVGIFVICLATTVEAQITPPAVIPVPSVILPHATFPPKPWAFVNAAAPDPFSCENTIAQLHDTTEVPYEWMFSKVTMCAKMTDLQTAFPATPIDTNGIYTVPGTGEKVVLQEFIITSMLKPAKEPMLFPDANVTLTMKCGGSYGCSPNFFGYFSKDPDCRTPMTTIERFVGTGATYYNLTEMYLTVDLRQLYGFYYICYARTKEPNLDFVHHANGVYNYTDLNIYLADNPDISVANATATVPIPILPNPFEYWDPVTQQFDVAAYYANLFVTRWKVNQDLVYWNGAHFSQFVFPGHGTLDHKEMWHSVPDFVNSGIQIFVFPAHSWDYNFRGPRPILLNVDATKNNFPNDDATFLVLRSNSPDPIEFYLANASVAEQDFEPLSPYMQTSNCDVPSEIVESTRTNFSSVLSMNAEVSILYEGNPEYKLFAYVDTKDLLPRRTYTLCTQTFGSAELLRTWTTDLYAKPAHNTPYPTTSLVTNMFRMYPGEIFNTSRIFLGDENCKVGEFNLRAMGTFSQPVTLDFGPFPPPRAQILLTKFVNYDIIDNPTQTLRFYCPNARASTCLEGITTLFIANISTSCMERVTPDYATALDLSQIVGVPRPSEYKNFTAVVESWRLKPMQLYDVCIDYDGPNGFSFPTGPSTTSMTNYQPLQLDKLFTNPVKRFVPAGFVHFGIPATLKLEGFAIDANDRSKTSLHITDVLETTPSGNPHSYSDLSLYLSMEKNCDFPEGDYFKMNQDVFTVTLVPRGAHICMRVVETLKGNSTFTIGVWGGDTSLKVEAILATHPEVFLTKFQVCEMPVWTPSLLTTLATGRDVTLYGGSTGTEIILSGFKGGPITGFQSTRIGPFTCYTHCADVVTTTRRLYLSSFPTLDQQMTLDTVKKRVDRNCLLNGLWCPSICETKAGIYDSDNFLIRSDLATSEWVAGEEFWLNLDYTQMRPGKHYALCVFFNRFETSAATNPRFMTPTGTRRVNDLWPDQYTTAKFPSGAFGGIAPGYSMGPPGAAPLVSSGVPSSSGSNETNATNITDSGLTFDDDAEATNSTADEDSGMAENNITSAELVQVDMVPGGYVKNDEFTQVVPSTYEVYISPLIQTEYRTTKADVKQQIRVFCPMLHSEVICHNNTAQFFLADNRQCLEKNRRTSYSAWRKVVGNPSYDPEPSTSFSSLKENEHAITDDEVTLTDKRHYTFNRDPYEYKNETYIVTLDTSHLLTDYYYFLCVDIDGIEIPIAWNSSFAGWTGIVVYVTPIYGVVEFTNTVRQNDTERQSVRVLAEKGIKTGWVDGIIPPDSNLTYGEANEVIPRNCRVMRNDEGNDWVTQWQEVDTMNLKNVNYSTIPLVEEPYFYAGVPDFDLYRGGELSDGLGFGMNYRDWNVKANEYLLPLPGNGFTRQFVFPQIGPGGRELAVYELLVNTSSLREGTHYQLCASRDKTNDAAFVARYSNFTSWSHYTFLNPVTGVDLSYSGIEIGSPIYGAVQHLLATVEPEAKYLLAGHQDVQISDYDILGNLIKDSLYYNMGGSTEERIFVSGFQSFNEPCMTIGKSNYTVSCTACEIVGRYAYICADCETAVHFAPSFNECGKRPWTNWVFSVNAPPFCVEVSPFPDLIIECYPDPSRKQIWTPVFSDFIKYGAYYSLCLKHHGRDWGNAGVEDIFIAPAEANTDVILVRNRYDFFVTLDCYYTCRIVYDDLVNQTTALNDTEYYQQNGGTYDESLVTMEKGGIPWIHYPTFDWPDPNVTEVTITRHCTSECDRARGYLKANGPFVFDRYCTRDATHGLKVVPIDGDNFNRTYTDTLRFEDGIKSWNEPVMYTRKMKLPVQTEDYAPRAFYDVCLDSGNGYGPLKTTGQIFMRDQGIKEIVTRSFNIGPREYIWVDCEGCIPGVTRIFLQRDIYQVCLPQFFEAATMSGKDTGNPTATMAAENLWYLDSECVETSPGECIKPGRRYRMCIDLDGADSNLMEYEMVDDTFITATETRMWFSPVTRLYNPRALVKASYQYVFVDMAYHFYTPPSELVLFYFSEMECGLDAVGYLPQQDMTHELWGFTPEDSWKYTSLQTLVYTEDQRGPEFGPSEYQGIIPSFDLQSSARLWWFTTNTLHLRSGYFYRGCTSDQQRNGFGDVNQRLYVSPVTHLATETVEPLRRQDMFFECADCYEQETLVFWDLNCTDAVPAFVKIANIDSQVASKNLTTEWNALLASSINEVSYYTSWNNRSENTRNFEYPIRTYHGNSDKLNSPIVDFLFDRIYPNMPAILKEFLLMVRDNADKPNFYFYYDQFTDVIVNTTDPTSNQKIVDIPLKEYWPIRKDFEMAAQGEQYKQQLEDTLPVHTDLTATLGFPYQIVFLGKSLLQQPSYPELQYNTTWKTTIDMSYAFRGKHYELCIRRNVTLATGPSGKQIYVNPVRALLDISIKMENYEKLDFDCPVCEIYARGLNAYRPRAYLSVETDGCKQVGQITSAARQYTAAELIDQAPNTLESFQPGFNSRLSQNARTMQSGQTYKLCVDIDGFGPNPPHSNYWGYPVARFGWALPHRVYVSPITIAGRSIFDDGSQELEFVCPYQGCVSGQSILFMEKFVVGRSNLEICKTPADQSSPVQLVDVAAETNVADNYRAFFDTLELSPGWYRLCFDYDGLHGNTYGENLVPGWSEHYVYNSGVYNAFNYGLAKASQVVIFVNCNGCIPGTSIAYLSRDCEINYTEKGANYTSNFDIQVVQIPAFPYGYRLVGDTSNLMHAWNYKLCLSLSADLVAEPIGTSLNFYISPVQKIQFMTMMPLKYMPLRLVCSACEAGSKGYLSYQCETQDGLLPPYQSGGHFDQYTAEVYYEKLTNTCGKKECTPADWALLIEANAPEPGIRPGRHYNLCMMQNNELGNAMPLIYVTPILKQPVWNWRPDNFTSNYFTIDPLDDVWLYGITEPLYYWPHGFTACAWFNVNPVATQSPTKPRAKENPIIDGERYGIYVDDDNDVRFFFRDSMVEESRKEATGSISPGIHHACGVFTATKNPLQGGVFIYYSDIKLYLNGAYTSELKDNGRLQMEWDYLYTMVGASRRFQSQTEGYIYDARYYEEPLSDELVSAVYQEGYQYPRTTREITKSNETEINFYCYVNCVGSEVVLSLDCDDLEDTTKTSGYATVTNLRNAILDTTNCRQGLTYEICWKIQPPEPDFTQYVPRWGKTGAKVLVLTNILSTNVTETTVNTIKVEVIQQSQAAFHCKELLATPDPLDTSFAEIPSWVRHRGQAVQTWHNLTDNGAFAENDYRGEIIFTKLKTFTDYKIICVSEGNRDDMWTMYAKTQLAAATSALPRVHRILNGDYTSPFHNGLVIRVATQGISSVQCRLIGSNKYYLGDSPSLHEIDPFVAPKTYHPMSNPQPTYPDPNAAPKGAQCFGGPVSFIESNNNANYNYNRDPAAFLYENSGPANGTAGCGYSNITKCDYYCDVGIDGLYPDTDYEFECYTLFVPDVKVTGKTRTATPTLSCGPYTCVAIDSFTGMMTEFNQTKTIYLQTSQPVRALATNGKTTCGILAADVRSEIDIRDHYVECVGSQTTLFQSLTDAYYMVSLGEFHRCGIKRGLLAQIECTGQDRWGQLIEQAVSAADSVEYHQVSCGWTHCCALSNAGDLKCWGWLASEIPMPTATKFKEVCAGRGYSCGVRMSDGIVQCWGTNEFGQSIIENSTVANRPFRKVGCGIHHSCGIDINRKVHCWGADVMGQLILGSDILQDEFMAIGVGFYHACAMALSGRIRCWGPSLETEFVIRNYTHANILEANPSASFSYPTVIPNLADPDGPQIDMAAPGWSFFTPKEVDALDYKNLNFLPMTTKFNYTSTGSGESGIPNRFA